MLQAPPTGVACVCVAFACRHPFPPHWQVSSSDNFTEEHLTSGPEFNDVQHRLHASLPDATLIHVTRYVRVVQACQEHVACFSLTRRFFVTCSIHNRFQWERYSQRCDSMWSMRRITETSSRDDVLHKTWLWHGTSGTDPRVLCTGQDGIDFRRVRRVCLASSMSSPCHGVHDHGHGCVSYRSPVGWLLWCAMRAWLVYGWHATCGQARDDVGLFYGRTFRIPQHTVMKATRMFRPSSRTQHHSSTDN